MKNENKPDKNRHILEQGRRLSDSMLWELQRRYFTEEGPKAWGGGAVPYYITSNPFIANAYARVVLSYLRDAIALGADLSEPFYIAELGTGSGRFSFCFLRALLPLLARIRPQAPTICYVMTDFVEKTIEFWEQHQALRPFVEEGVLDFALFDATNDKEIKLRNSKVTLGQKPLANPFVVLANYFFDGLPQDAFFLSQGELLEGLVSLSSSSSEPDPLDPSLLARVALRYEKRSVKAEGYYQDQTLNRLLAYYQQSFPHMALRFPIVSFGCCEVLRKISGGRLLLLTSDKGYIDEEVLTALRAPRIAVHGSFSMGVNYHAIRRYFQLLGGEALHGGHPHEHLTTLAFLLGDTQQLHQTKEAFEDHIANIGPDEFFSLKRALEHDPDALPLSSLLALLRLGGDDSWLVCHYQPQLIEKVKVATEVERKEISQLLDRAWDGYYHIGEGTDFPFGAGMILYEMGLYTQALVFFERSLGLYGIDANTYYNIGLCHYQEQRPKEAFVFIEKATRLQPEHKAAKDMLIELKEGKKK
jgi:tetratricopeptide (TPR) repeat protein